MGAIGRKWWGRWDTDTDCYASLPPDREDLRGVIEWVNHDQVTSNRSRITNLTWEVFESHCSGESGSDAWEVRPQSIGLQEANEGRIGISEWSSCISILIEAHHDGSMLMIDVDGISSKKAFESVWLLDFLSVTHFLPFLLFPPIPPLLQHPSSIRKQSFNQHLTYHQISSANLLTFTQWDSPRVFRSRDTLPIPSSSSRTEIKQIITLLNLNLSLQFNSYLYILPKPVFSFKDPQPLPLKAISSASKCPPILHSTTFPSSNSSRWVLDSFSWCARWLCVGFSLGKRWLYTPSKPLVVQVHRRLSCLFWDYVCQIWLYPFQFTL